MAGEIITHERNIAFILEDAFGFLFKANEATDDLDDQQMFSRSSITFTLLLVEAAANALLDSLALARSVANDMDRLSILAKFDFFKRITCKGVGLNRGDRRVQELNELKNLRDRLVHPKRRLTRWSETPSGGMVSESEKVPLLSVSSDPWVWDFSAALAIARAVHGFLNDFLLGQCELSSIQSAAVLYSGGDTPSFDEDDFGIPALVLLNKQWFSERDISVDYLLGRYSYENLPA